MPHISFEGKIGISLALVGLGGAGALFVLPHPYADYVGWTLIAIALLGLIGLTVFHWGSPEKSISAAGERPEVAVEPLVAPLPGQPLSPPMVMPPPEAVARVQNEVARAAAKMPHSEEPPNLERLFIEDPDGLIRLRFMPDTPKREEDALLLIVYGHKVIGGKEDVSTSIAYRGLSVSGGAIKKLKNPKQLLFGFTPLVDFDKIERELVDGGMITKYKLSQGGYLAITPAGMVAAGALADNLIKRA